MSQVRPSPAKRARPAMPVVYGPRRQAGFSLTEVAIAIAVVLIISIVGLPAINGYVLESRVTAVATELQRFIGRTKVMGEGASITPYADIDNEKNLAPALVDSTVFRVTGSVVAHRLGGRGSGTDGTLTLEPADLGSGGTGSAFALTATNVNERACPILASLLHAVSEAMAINGTVVKTLGTDNAQGSYNPVAAQEACTRGDTNEFTFTTR